MQQSIVVTGLGLVTSIGIGREAFWHNLLMGRSGIGPVQAFDTSAYRGGMQGAEVIAFRAADYLVRLDPAGMGRASQFATAAARLAIADAQLDVSAVDPELSERAHALTGALALRSACAIEERFFREHFRREWIVAIAAPEGGA